MGCLANFAWNAKRSRSTERRTCQSPNSTIPRRRRRTDLGLGELSALAMRAGLGVRYWRPAELPATSAALVPLASAAIGAAVGRSSAAFLPRPRPATAVVDLEPFLHRPRPPAADMDFSCLSFCSFFLNPSAFSNNFLCSSTDSFERSAAALCAFSNNDAIRPNRSETTGECSSESSSTYSAGATWSAWRLVSTTAHSLPATGTIGLAALGAEASLCRSHSTLCGCYAGSLATASDFTTL